MPKTAQVKEMGMGCLVCAQRHGSVYNLENAAAVMTVTWLKNKTKQKSVHLALKSTAKKLSSDVNGKQVSDIKWKSQVSSNKPKEDVEGGTTRKPKRGILSLS